MHGIGGRAVVPVAFVYQPDLQVLLHGLDDGGQVFLPGGDVLEENPPAQAAALVDDVVYRECIEKPGAHGSVGHVLRVLDVVAVSAAPVALDVDVKCILNRILPVVECPERNVTPVADR